MFKSAKLAAIGIVGFALILVTVGCASVPSEVTLPEAPQVEAQVVLTAAGSATTTGVLTAIKPSFETDMPGYTLNTMTGSGTGGGVEGVIEGVLDVASMARQPKDEEENVIEWLQIGYGPEMPIVHADVQATSLTTLELIDIFSGEITNWSEVGGQDMHIIVYVRGSDTSHTEIVREYIFDDTPFAETAQVMGSLGDMISAVEGTPGGIGYANVPGVVSRGANVKAIAVDGVEPGDPAYPAVLDLGIGYLPERQDDVQPLVDWLLSEHGQAALQEINVITAVQ